uniref:Uncharacterized protein n=1 Tax=Rhizophagus irregularis (strain DAOM 181602 / DAOM 197198 / MUCL 43194) TaxID=747089 RepID=U9UX34_RHIID
MGGIWHFLARITKSWPALRAKSCCLFSDEYDINPLQNPTILTNHNPETSKSRNHIIPDIHYPD